MLAGGDGPPDWPATGEARRYDAEPRPEIRARYALARDGAGSISARSDA
jgi:hypothetical protein